MAKFVLGGASIPHSDGPQLLPPPFSPAQRVSEVTAAFQRLTQVFNDMRGQDLLPLSSHAKDLATIVIGFCDGAHVAVSGVGVKVTPDRICANARKMGVEHALTSTQVAKLLPDLLKHHIVVSSSDAFALQPHREKMTARSGLADAIADTIVVLRRASVPQERQVPREFPPTSATPHPALAPLSAPSVNRTQSPSKIEASTNVSPRTIRAAQALISAAREFERAYNSLNGRNPAMAELNEKVLVWYDRAALVDGRFDRVYPQGLARLRELAASIQTRSPDTARELSDPARFKEVLLTFWGRSAFLDTPKVQALQATLMGKDHKRHEERFPAYSQALRIFLTAVDHAAASGVMHEELQSIAKRSIQQHLDMMADLGKQRPEPWTVATTLMNTLTHDRYAAGSNLFKIARACGEFGQVYERDNGQPSVGFPMRVARALERSCRDFEASLRSITERAESLRRDAAAYDQTPNDPPRDFDKNSGAEGSPYAVNYFTPDPARARETHVLGEINSVILHGAVQRELTLTALRLGVVNSARAEAIAEGLQANRRTLLAFSVAGTSQQAIEAVATTKFSAVPPAIRVAEIVEQIRLLAAQWIAEHQGD